MIWPDRLELDALGPGRHRLELDLDAGHDAGVMRLPLAALVGAAPRPRLALVAGVHGDEYDGILALHGLARELDPAELAGSLLIIPVAHPAAFHAGQRTSPHDGLDLNRVFPGDPDGHPTERLAALLALDLLQQADAVFSLHGASASGVIAPWVEFLASDDAVGQASFAMARASGFSDLMALDERPGRLLRAMAELGVPLIEGEVGGGGATRPENVAYYKARVRAVAGHLGVMAAPQSVPQPAEQAIWHLEPPVMAPVGGLWVRGVELRQAVRQGEPLGEIVDLRGETLATIAAPLDGVVGGTRERAGVQAGESLVTLWAPAQACADRPER